MAWRVIALQVFLCLIFLSESCNVIVCLNVYILKQGEKGELCMKNKKKIILLPISVALIAVLFIGIRLLMPYICFKYYTNKALAVTSKETVHYLVQKSCFNQNKTYPNEIFTGKQIGTDLMIQHAEIATNKLFPNSGLNITQRTGKKIKGIYGSEGILNGRIRGYLNKSSEDSMYYSEDRIYTLQLKYIRFNCVILVIVSFTDFKDAEKVASYYGIDLPDISEMPVNEYFFIDKK